MANNLGLDAFPDFVGHFGAPWRPFWIFEVLIEGMIESKNLFGKSWLEGPITWDLTHFRIPSPTLDKAGGEVLQAVQRCRR